MTVALPLALSRPGFQLSSDAARPRGRGDPLGSEAQVYFGEALGAVLAVAWPGAVARAAPQGGLGHAVASEAPPAAGADGLGVTSELGVLCEFFSTGWAR